MRSKISIAVNVAPHKFSSRDRKKSLKIKEIGTTNARFVGRGTKPLKFLPKN
jgi:hypothetical protein